MKVLILLPKTTLRVVNGISRSSLERHRCLFSDKDGIFEPTAKIEYVLPSKSENATVHQKQTELTKEGRSASAIVSRSQCTGHP